MVATPSLNWLNIKSHNGSQNSAFEELVCQLAREEEIPNKKTFPRVGAPDGGVEAYCTLDNGDEYGWQAKYFPSMDTSQWKQLEKSFKTAFEKHPRLTKYYICIPLDRQDPRIGKQKWFMDRWDENVIKWKNIAKKKRRNIEFEYWGNSELLHRLSSEKYKGRIYYWFQKEEFSDDWFNERLDRSIADLGNRYSPELNYELDIAKIFDGLARDENFKKQFDALYSELLVKFSKFDHSLTFDETKEDKGKVNKSIDDIKSFYQRINFNEVSNINYATLREQISAIRESLDDIESVLSEARKKLKDTPKDATKKEDYYNKDSRYSSGQHYLDAFSNCVYDLENFLLSRTAQLSNIPMLILTGEAGIGKSHLLADIANKRMEQGKPSILLLGQHFVADENPWTQILKKLLCVSCNQEEFLGALESKAQSIGSRIIIFIDAINEGRGKYFWTDNIRGFIKSFEKYKWLGLVMSVRTSYENLLVPEELYIQNKAIKVIHGGFIEVEYEASKLFFRNYKIKQPSIPLLHPEFRNPLFLKLFCDGLSKMGLTTIPDGYEGISAIINFYLKAINRRLSEPKRLNYPESLNLVEKSVALICKRLIDSGDGFIPFDEAHHIIQKEFNIHGVKNFLDELIFEGVMSKNLFWKGKDKEEGVYLTYERFADHLKASFMLEKYLNESNPAKSFREGQKLFNLIKDQQTCWGNKGFIESLSVQLPERIGKELYEVAPHCQSYYPVIESFVNSLVWRKSEALTPKLLEYINKFVVKNQRTNDLFLDTLLSISANPKNYFNADFLHKHLMRFTLSDRDAWWSIYIHRQFSWQNSVKRIIDWAWSEENKSHISDESIRLTSVTIAWFLTSSNRYLRDAATKALVGLLENRIQVLVRILKHFEKVNDPYVYERLFAVAYGCALRTKDTQRLKDLSEYIYKSIFDTKYVYPHILLRDYARGVIEYTLFKGISLAFDSKKIKPPYKSKLPKIFPSDNDIEKLILDPKDDVSKEYWRSQNKIIMSMRTEGSGRGYGDFGRYVFQAAFRNWELNAKILSNWAVKRIFELGYDVEKHGEFDNTEARGYPDSRSPHKAERIGKKYQWIAFYEILAIISDLFPISDPTIWRERKMIPYEGPWQPYLRDIDPTFLIKDTNKAHNNIAIDTWLCELKYDSCNCSNSEWLSKSNDLPNPVPMLIAKDNKLNEWIILEIHPDWDEPTPLGEEKYDSIKKFLWYQIRSYLIKESDFRKITNWGKNTNFMGRWMPEASNRYEVFSREFFCSPAYKYFNQPYYHGESWREIKDIKKKKTIGKAIVTSEIFLWEERYDCSKEETIIFFKPCETIFDGMKMKFAQSEGELLNQKNELVCLDPSVNNKSLSCLLVRKNDFLDFLKKKRLKIFWTVLGEKYLIGDGHVNQNEKKRLEISGFYYLKNDDVVGKLNTKVRKL